MPKRFKVPVRRTTGGYVMVEAKDQEAAIAKVDDSLPSELEKSFIEDEHAQVDYVADVVDVSNVIIIEAY